MTWNVVHNFPGAKDTYEVPIDYPTINYDTIIASWFTDVFTSILAIQDVLIGEGALFLPKAGGTMTGDLTISKAIPKVIIYGTSGNSILEFSDDVGGGATIRKAYGDEALYINKHLTLENGLAVEGDVLTVVVGIESEGSIVMGVGQTVDGIDVSNPVWPVDIEVSNKTKGLILKSPNDSRFRLEVSDGGVLSTEAL